MTASPMVTVSIFLVVFLGAFIQGTIGFGMALVGTPLLILVEPKTVPGPMITAAFVLSSLVLLYNREGIDLSGIGWLVAGRLVGTAISIFIMSVISKDVLGLVIGTLILVGIFFSVTGLQVKLNKTTLVSAGALSGFMGTIASVGGPPLALLYRHRAPKKFRETLAGFFIFGSLISIISLILAGRYTANELHLLYPIIPAVISGFFLSTFFSSRVSNQNLSMAIYVISGLSAVTVIYRSIV